MAPEQTALAVPRSFVFIGGAHRSGTTLLARELAAHPDVTGLAGTGACEDEGQHVQSVYPPEQAHGGPNRFAFSDDAHMTEHSPLASAECRARLERDWGRFWDASRPVVVEKSPPNILKTRFLQALFPGCELIMLIRHPIAVITAMRQWGNHLLRPKPYTRVRHWLACYERLLEDAAHVTNLSIVRYEDLVESPEAIVAALHARAGRSASPLSLSVRSGLDERYFGDWDRARRNPIRRAYRDAVIRRFEARVNRFGYSLEHPRARLDAAPNVEALTVRPGVKSSEASGPPSPAAAPLR